MKRNYFGILILFATLLSFSSVAKSEKILFLTPIAFKSALNVFEPLIRELGSRGHNLTVLTSIKYKNMPATVEQISPVSFEDIKMENTFATRKKGRLSLFLSWNDSFVLDGCHRLYQNPLVQDIIATKTYDLVIINGYMNQCATGILHRLKSPFMIILTMPAPQNIAGKVGNFNTPSFVPTPFLPFTDRMTFIQKLANIAFEFMMKISFGCKFNPKYEAIYRKYLGEDVPGIDEIDRNVSMILTNSHFSMSYPRPLLPDIVEVGGMHCRPAKPLPQDLEKFVGGPKDGFIYFSLGTTDLEKFVGGAEDGFIYFSLGTIVRPQEMPENSRKAFLNVFSRLKQRVIWKWDAEMSDLPENVKVFPFLPQQDILGHPNLKIFMTHGGLLSTQEAIYFGVPLLGIPVFGDQDLNMHQAEQYGYCLQMEILDFTEEELEKKINRLLYEPSFKQRASELSRIFRDQSETPLERAVYWSEYIIRHKGATHLRSAARELNFFQYHSLDVLSIFLALILLFLFVARLIFRLICRKICRLLGKCENSPVSSSKGKSAKKTN